MRRARRLFRGSRRRSVSWIPGFSGMDDATGASARTLAFAGPIAGTTTTWGVASTLVSANDLTFHGGEDCVLSRIRGWLAPCHGQRDAGAGFGNWSFSLRFVVYQHQAVPAGTFNDAFTRSNDLQQDNILYTAECICTSDGLIDSANTVDFDQIWRVDFDVKAKRKVQEDRPIVLAMQTCAPAGTVGLKMQLAGNLRMLLMRPR